MKVEFLGSFSKDLKDIKDKKLMSRVQAAILAVEAADNLQQIPFWEKKQGRMIATA